MVTVTEILHVKLQSAAPKNGEQTPSRISYISEELLSSATNTARDTEISGRNYCSMYLSGW
jgi:hypothetical protein